MNTRIIGKLIMIESYRQEVEEILTVSNIKTKLRKKRLLTKLQNSENKDILRVNLSPWQRIGQKARRLYMDLIRLWEVRPTIFQV